MFRKTRLKRTIAIFLLANMVFYIFTPLVAHASLTAGPTAPEYTSFEPVDTTDMVNLATGDFTYNIPLLEVPGPEGGYPISMAYHAGIQPGQEASWVGLGWTLNTGAVNRYVGGYADDYLRKTKFTRQYIDGGVRTQYDFGISMGIGVADLKFGLSVEAKENGGFGGVNHYVTANAFGVGATFSKSGVSNVGFNPLSTMQSFSALKAAKAQAKNTVKKSRANDYYTEENASVIGVLRSNASKQRWSSAFAGSSSGGSNISGKWNSSVNSRFAQLGPFSFSKSKIHTWFDETDAETIIGPLHFDQVTTTGVGNDLENAILDSSPINDISGINQDEHPNRAAVGSTPSKDVFQVNAQGLSGTMSVHNYSNGSLFRSDNRPQPNADVYGFEYKFKQAHNASSFRFDNEFSNKYLIDQDTKLKDIAGGSDFEIVDYSTEYNSSYFKNNQLAGTKHIEWFTNSELDVSGAPAKGFLKVEGFDYGTPITATTGYDVSDQIGGFMITNESGATYHYALPVYNLFEYSKVVQADEPLDTYTENLNRNPYAYTWLLTAITGPDYVDKNGNGFLDDDDWGYWVKFDYGKWADDYQWRNPALGVHEDGENGTETFSYGQKQLYYLDFIRTRSHTALFVKELRRDGKGVADLKTGKMGHRVSSQQETTNGTFWSETTSDATSRFSLRLDQILLIDNDNFGSETFSSLRNKNPYWGTESTNEAYSQNPVYYGDTEAYFLASQNGFSGPGYLNYVNSLQNFGNVLDVYDLIKTDIEDYSIRGTLLGFDYKLRYNVKNSFSKFKGNANAYGVGGADDSQFTGDRSLTLKSVASLGKGGQQVIPATDFDYHNETSGFGSTDFKYHDSWGAFKSNYSDGIEEYYKYITNEISQNDKKAWSLKNINTPLGGDIEIEYESDDYSKAAFHPLRPIAVEDGVLMNDRLRIQLQDPVTSYALQQLSVGDFVTMDHVIFNQLVVETDEEVIEGGGTGNIDFVLEPSREVQTQSNFQIKALSPGYIDFELDVYTQTFVDNTSYDYSQGPDGYIFEKKLEVGLIYLPDDVVNVYGGGLRVKSVTTSDSQGNGTKVNYSYTNPLTGKSSGVTSFEPFNFYAAIPASTYLGSLTNKMREKFYKPLGLRGFLPPPGISYEYVTVSTSEIHPGPISFDLPGKVEYHFQPLEDDMLEIVQPVTSDINGVDHISPFTIKDFTNNAGQLLSIKTFNDNSSVPSATQTNDYLWSSIVANNYPDLVKNQYAAQGIFEEMYNESRRAYQVDVSNKTYDENNEEYVKVLFKREIYPSILMSESSEDTKTGVSSKTEYISFDFITGNALKQVSKDSYGNEYVSITTPAYTIYPDMGHKVDNINNKNMLTQVASNRVYKRIIDPSADPGEQEKGVGLVDASVQTWSNQFMPLGETSIQTSVWRPYQSYSWVGDVNGAYLRDDGLYQYDDEEPTDFETFLPFVNPQLSIPEGWQKSNEVNLYDVYSHTLEVSDVNGDYAATKLDNNHRRVLASAVLSKYSEIAYSGAEDYKGGDFGGGVKRNGGEIKSASVDAAPTHTGDKSMKLNLATKGFEFVSNDVSQGKYRVGLWSSVSGAVEINYSYKINGVTTTSTVSGDNLMPDKQAGNWYLVRGYIDVPDNVTDFSVFVKGLTTVYVDDFRFHPLQSAMVSYVYNEWGELSHTLDSNNLFTQYEYDVSGRLKAVYRERIGPGRLKLTEQEINYQKSLN